MTKFVKSYEFDLIFITEYFVLIQLLKMPFTIILIIVFLGLERLRPVLCISGEA
jgi:hypothetical protein